MHHLFIRLRPTRVQKNAPMVCTTPSNPCTKRMYSSKRKYDYINVYKLLCKNYQSGKDGAYQWFLVYFLVQPV